MQRFALLSWACVCLLATSARTAQADDTETSTSSARAAFMTDEPGRPRTDPTPMPPMQVIIEETPVVLAKAGDLGLFFRFGGLGSLVASNNTRVIDQLMITQAGLKVAVSDKLMVPIVFGAGVQDPGGSRDVTAGLDLGVGLEYHFRIWRRISPFLGANLGLSVIQDDSNDLIVGLGIGPTLGIEYYIADRVSLTAQYLGVLQIGISDKDEGFEFATLAGGAMNLTCYF